MPHYYFDVEDGGDFFRDDSGFVCDDKEAVRKAAIEALPTMAASALPDGDHHRIAVKVRDGTGDYIYVASLTLHAGWVEERPES